MNLNHKKILLVEDDINLGTILKDFLSLKEYKVDHCLDGKEGKMKYDEGKYDLILLDVMMPKVDGFTLASQIRKVDKQTPIIFLTAKSMLEDKLKGLKLGGDDYITKPFSSEELFLRIENIFKRVSSVEPLEDVYLFVIGKYKFDYRNRLLSDNKKKQKLTSKEAELLKELAINKNQLVERNEILRKIWKEESYFTARSMDVFITKLRSYLKSDEKVQIINVHGTGFKLIA